MSNIEKTFIVDRVSGSRFELKDHPDEELSQWMSDKKLENMHYEYE